mmetsp:Transcript_70482/g.223290  ORF Transcript_70482/g.223290 Transcript_70482/m.223290 type:complete len:355 (+) Transcript_70482:809-1873(+)
MRARSWEGGPRSPSSCSQRGGRARRRRRLPWISWRGRCGCSTATATPSGAHASLTRRASPWTRGCKKPSKTSPLRRLVACTCCGARRLPGGCASRARARSGRFCCSLPSLRPWHGGTRRTRSSAPAPPRPSRACASCSASRTLCCRASPARASSAARRRPSRSSGRASGTSQASLLASTPSATLGSSRAASPSSAPRRRLPWRSTTATGRWTTVHAPSERRTSAAASHSSRSASRTRSLSTSSHACSNFPTWPMSTGTVGAVTALPTSSTCATRPPPPSRSSGSRATSGGAWHVPTARCCGACATAAWADGCGRAWRSARAASSWSVSAARWRRRSRTIPTGRMSGATCTAPTT